MSHIVFSKREQRLPAGLLNILLIRAGTEQNPGPPTITWKCSVCKGVIKNTTSVLCNICKEWCHLKKCSNLTSHRKWNNTFVASCCSNKKTLHPYPAQTTNNTISGQQEPHSFNILQLNCNGLRDKGPEICHFMEKNNIMVAALQETKLNNKVNVTIPNYTVTRVDREKDRGGGLAFLIHKDVKFHPINLPSPVQNDATLEQQAIKVISGHTEITLVNVYIPPTSSCPTGYNANVEHILQLDDCIIMGDFNAHHNSWHSSIPDDSRGTSLADQFENSDFGILNEDSPTRVSNNCSSSPDITLASSSLLTSSEWAAMPALSSDHFPIILKLQRKLDKCKSDKRTFTNFSKANWEAFLNHTEIKFSRVQPPHNIHTGERTFRLILGKAARLYIPSGRIPIIRPNFPTEAAKLADERDELRSTDPHSQRIQHLSKQIKYMVNDHIRNKWRSHLDKSGFRPDTKNLWNTIKKLSNKQQRPDNISICFNDTAQSNDKKCANEFNRQFTSHTQTAEKSTRKTLRKLHVMKASNEVAFTEDQVAKSIKAMKNSKAMGPDHLSPIMLKHLGPNAITYLALTLNLSVSTAIIPGVWKVGRIIPLLKPGKPADQSTSYRPISLLSPVAKLLESLLLPIFVSNLKPAKHQHGFRKGHSTTTALHKITDTIQKGLNQPRPNQRTVLVALDLSRAFDTVNHGVLLREISESTLPITVKKWISNYLRGRQTFVEFRGATSKYRKMKQGVPQGGVLSPILFNSYMADLPTPPPSIKVVSYADDISLMATNHSVQEACRNLNNYLEEIHQWLIAKQLELSTAKSTATLFTTWTHEVKTILDIHVNGFTIPTVAKPKILGVTFDNLLTFSAHVKATCNKLKGRNNILKALAGSTWGKDKEVIITTYKAIGRSILNYAAPVWSPQISNTSWSKLQISQNAALRVATGCHLMANVDHLHVESKVLPVKEHNTLLAKQYLLSCNLRNHPCNAIINEPPPPRHIKIGLTTAHAAGIQAAIPTEGLDSETHKQGLKLLHTDAVETAIISYSPNRVLNASPPEVHISERILPRMTRTTLAQLRSGWCRLLNSYRSRIEPDIDNVCPLCGDSPHDTQHLFNCREKPTDLGVISLWTKPIEAAAFLELMTTLDMEEN